MARWLLLIALGVAAWLLWGTRRQAPSPKTGPVDVEAHGPVVMACCAHCGVHLPEADVLRDESGHAFCCPDHLKAGVRR